MQSEKYRGLFITGTDTDVGKTIVGRGIVGGLTGRGVKVAVAKPVESGAPQVDGRLVGVDAMALMRAGSDKSDIDDVCAYAFPDPVSPHLAASRVGRTIEMAPILELLRRRASAGNIVIAEGAGGLMVPLGEGLLYADLMASTGFRLVIVAPNILGTINATLLTIEAARSRGIEIAGVVLNFTPGADLGNAEAIAKFGGVKILGQFPTAEGASDAHLAALAQDHLDLDALLVR